jgi:pimeloyl-ACP methyl ester carboxylesterase
MLNIRHTTQERWLGGPSGRMRYWKSEPREGVPIVLLHGYSSLIEHWNRVVPCLTRNHPCYALDLYGFGYSAPLREVPSRQVWVEQVAYFIQHVVQAPAVLVGNSLGGMVVAQLAHDYPQLAHGLVLVDSIGLPDAPTFYPLAERAFYRIIKVPMLGETMAKVLGRPLGVLQFLFSLYHRRERISPAMVADLSGPLSQPRAALFRLEILRSIETFDLDLRPGDVLTPTLIIWGERDPILPPPVAYRFKRQMFPAAEVQLIPESGHCPFDETPDEFCDILLSWLCSISVNCAA